MTYTTSASDIINWLESAVDTVGNVKLIRERYNMASSAWISRYRSDCGMEAALAFLMAWKSTGDEKYLTLSRDLYAGVISMQNNDGSFPYYRGAVRAYTNDNSEIAIFLFRMAEIDEENREEYRAKALEITDFLVNTQNADGTWPRSTEDPTRSPLFTAHAVSALAMAHKYTANKNAYQSAAETALAWIAGKIKADGRITLAGTNEEQRPPSSDQSVVIRAYAMAELYLRQSEKVQTWKTQRLKMIAWFLQLITEEGAVKNGLGEGLNGADTPNITDHVYTTPFAVEALFYSYCVDGNIDYWDKAAKIVSFVQSNIYYSDNANANGVLRGAYNLKDRNWDTSEALLDSSQQGGGDMVYTGWTNAPLAAMLFERDSIVTDNFLSVWAKGTARRFFDQNDGIFRVFNQGVSRYRLVSPDSIWASDVKMQVGGEVKAFAYL